MISVPFRSSIAHHHQPASPQMDLASTYRALHRAQYFASLDTTSNHYTNSIPSVTTSTDKTSRPFLIPLYLCGVYIIPAIYLAIPHRSEQSKWIYVARWPLLAGLTWFHVQMILHVSSPNFASAYAAGLLGAWGVIWNLTVLVWTRPQWDGKRVEVRRRMNNSNTVFSAGRRDEAAGGQSSSFGAIESSGRNGIASSAARKRNGNGHSIGHANGGVDGHTSENEQTHKVQDGLDSRQRAQNGNGHYHGTARPQPCLGDDFEYFWQEFQEDAPFWTRLNWSFDYVAQFRMTGWNCAIPSLPPYEPPLCKGSKQLSLDTLPNRSRDGYTRVTTRRTYIYRTLFLSIIPSYILIDLLAVLLTHDPHFVVGPEHNLPLPQHLAALHPAARFLWRQVLSLLAILSALHLVLNFGQLCLCLFCRPLLGFRAEPWHLPSIMGSFTQVLDRGLSGFWGSWWHQTFRFGFSAPTKYLLRYGYITKGTLAADAASFAIAFVQSGFLHAAGSYTTVPESKWWMPPLTFLLSGVGMLLQQNLARLLWSRTSLSREATPRWVRRAANLVFVLAWLSLTAWPLLDDFGRAGLWLYEPVPVSLFRPLTKLGDLADRRVWRWDHDFFPRWYRGRSLLWDTGLGV
ncbi:uncharacterized protein B0I36DRAFT_317579 [Microdochium trichocladiopsis]|uniref:Wax synthase domain-containing protein n=1 Tax=Microdochium trichocladiopsis TaxID=1682393 RepID=A0A9P9BSZ1_9PEZI|nr:uncharacterized protein B0I36DRAFT_317579 [Microdochium trichocladiopsis]KAH7035084.1 hypothetical protein B0I36DRAFT_317579 [Microdochium trichocladiopsis]